MEQSTARIDRASRDGKSPSTGPIAAAAAAIAAYLAISKSVESQKTGREAHYYDLLVIQPMTKLLRTFARTVRERVQAAAISIEEITSENAPVDQLNDAVATLTDECNEEYYALLSEAKAAYEAMGDDDLNSDLRIGLEELQDEYAVELERIGTAPSPTLLDGVLDKNVTKMLRIIRKHDPGIADK